MKIWITNVRSISTKTAKSTATYHFIKKNIIQHQPDIAILTETNHQSTWPAVGEYAIYYTEPDPAQGVQIWIKKDLNPHLIKAWDTTAVAVGIAQDITILGVYCPANRYLKATQEAINEIILNNPNWVIAGDIEQFEGILKVPTNWMKPATSRWKRKGGQLTNMKPTEALASNMGISHLTATDIRPSDHYVIEVTTAISCVTRNRDVIPSRTRTEQAMEQARTREQVGRKWPQKMIPDIVPMKQIQQRQTFNTTIANIDQDMLDNGQAEAWAKMHQAETQEYMRKLSKGTTKMQWQAIRKELATADKQLIIISGLTRPNGTITNDRSEMNEMLRKVYQPIFYNPEYKEGHPERADGGPSDAQMEQMLEGIIDRLRDTRAMGVDAMPFKRLKEEPMRHNTICLIKHMIKANRVEAKWKIVRVMSKSKTPSATPTPEDTRTLSVLTSCYTIIEGYLRNYMDEPINKLIPGYQMGFKKGRSIIDNITLLKQMVSQATQHNKFAAVLALDLRKAYDLIHRQAVYEALSKTECPLHAQQLYKEITTGMKMKIGDHEHNIIIPYNNGVPQGSAIAPEVFNLTLDMALRKANLVEGYQIIGYADNITYVCTDPKEVNTIMEKARAMSIYGLEVSAKSTLLIAKGRKEAAKIQGISIAKEMKYLGTMVHKNMTQRGIKTRTRHIAEEGARQIRYRKYNYLTTAAQRTALYSLVLGKIRAQMIPDVRCGWLKPEEAEEAIVKAAKNRMGAKQIPWRFIRDYYDWHIAESIKINIGKTQGIKIKQGKRSIPWYKRLQDANPKQVYQAIFSKYWFSRKTGRPVHCIQCRKDIDITDPCEHVTITIKAKTTWAWTSITTWLTNCRKQKSINTLTYLGKDVTADIVQEIINIRTKLLTINNPPSVGHPKRRTETNRRKEKQTRTQAYKEHKLQRRIDNHKITDFAQAILYDVGEGLTRASDVIHMNRSQNEERRKVRKQLDEDNNRGEEKKAIKAGSSNQAGP